MNRHDTMVAWFEYRVKRNKNVILVVNGETGSGKTYAALDLAIKGAARLGTTFNIKDNMAFSFEELIIKTRLPQNRKPGTIFLFEEVGATQSGASNREWQGQANRFFTSFLQTIRHKNQILIFTCPLFSSLDLVARSLTHCQIMMRTINPASKKSFGTPYFLQVNSRSGKFYFKKKRFIINGVKRRLDTQVFDLPPADTLNIYEECKTKFTDALEKSIIDKAKAQRRKELAYKAPIDKNKVKEYTLLGMSRGEIANKLDVTPTWISMIRNELGLIKKLNKN